MVTDAHEVRVVNLWRSHRLQASAIERFVINQHNIERFGRWGLFRPS